MDLLLSGNDFDCKVPQIPVDLCTGSVLSNNISLDTFFKSLIETTFLKVKQEIFISGSNRSPGIVVSYRMRESISAKPN